MACLISRRSIPLNKPVVKPKRHFNTPYADHTTTLQAFASTMRKLFDIRLPRSFNDAVKDPACCDAIDREYNALVARNVWRYVPRTSSMQPLPYTWVFRLKPLNASGSECLHKARCVVRGDFQDPYYDFDPTSTYAPVASHESIRLLLGLAAHEHLIVEGGDVSNAYLYGKIDFPVIMEQPTNSSCKEAMPNHVCELLKSMYGSKRAGKIWGSLLCETLLSWGFKQSLIDPRVFYKSVKQEFIIVVVVVDDLDFASSSTNLLDYFKKRLQATFDVKLFGSLRTFVGWEITQNDDGIAISQARYANELLTKHNLNQANAVWTPLPANANISPAEDGEHILIPAMHSYYRTSIGELLYLAVCSRPDISFAVAALARHVHSPTTRHLNLLKRVMRYLSGTRNFGIRYNRSRNHRGLEAFADADWAGCRSSRQSTTGFVITYNGAPISWKSIKQTVVALSSAEAEYIAMSSCAKEMTWIRRLLWEFTNRQPFDDTATMSSVPLMVDSTAALGMAQQDNINAKSKHVEVKFHHIRSLVSDGVLALQHISTSDQVADVLTKAGSVHVLAKHRKTLLTDIYSTE